MIDKYQKGYIKDLIISGDSTFQAILEKYEKGDKKELEGDSGLFPFTKCSSFTVYISY